MIPEIANAIPEDIKISLPFMDAVDSSRVRSIGFECIKGGLDSPAMEEGWIYIEFHSGAIWRYGLFKRMNFENLREGTPFDPPSIGKAFGVILNAVKKSPELGLKEECIWKPTKAPKA